MNIYERGQRMRHDAIATAINFRAKKLVLLTTGHAKEMRMNLARLSNNLSKKPPSLVHYKQPVEQSVFVI